MFKVIKDLQQEIKDCHRYIKARGDNYDDVMNRESDRSEFDAGVISSTTQFINKVLPDIAHELREYMEKLWIKTRTEALQNIREEGIPLGLKSALEALETIDPSGSEENTIWWQGYLAGFNSASNSISVELSMQSISKTNPLLLGNSK